MTYQRRDSKPLPPPRRGVPEEVTAFGVLFGYDAFRDAVLVQRIYSPRKEPSIVLLPLDEGGTLPRARAWRVEVKLPADPGTAPPRLSVRGPVPPWSPRAAAAVGAGRVNSSRLVHLAAKALSREGPFAPPYHVRVSYREPPGGDRAAVIFVRLPEMPGGDRTVLISRDLKSARVIRGY